MDPTLPPATAAPGPAAPPAPAAPAPAPAGTGAISSDFNTFLRMLTVQMQNQDPLDPVDSADYAVQLATFSGVEQQVKTNDLLAALGAQLSISGLAEMATWVGREARAAMPGHFDGSPLTISPNPLAIADRVELVVRDAAGLEVSRVAIPKSAEPIEWAGVTADGAPLPPGPYRFEVVSLGADGTALLTAPAEVYGRVIEVRSEGGETRLIMEGGASVAASAVTALRAG